MKKKYLLILIIIVLVAGAGFIYWKKHQIKNTSTSTPVTSSISNTPNPTPAPDTLALPIADFQQRITKKPFGIYITPQNSPVSPERFSGYHTGTDVEYQDVTVDVPVIAVADGTVVLSRTASGYGGVFIIEIDLDAGPSTPLGAGKHTVLYGHIRPSSLPQLGQKVTKGEPIGLLGTGYSAETSGERRHLHLSVLSDNRIDLLGYVQNKSELSLWIDPVSLY